MKQLMTVIEDQGYVMIPAETAELAEEMLDLVTNDPRMKAFVREFLKDHSNWSEEAVVNFFLLQAITVNI